MNAPKPIEKPSPCGIRRKRPILAPLEDIKVFGIILIILIILLLIYSLIILSKVWRVRIANDAALDVCSEKLDRCLENLKEANEYYTGMKSTYKSHRLGQVGEMKSNELFNKGDLHG